MYGMNLICATYNLARSLFRFHLHLHMKIFLNEGKTAEINFTSPVINIPYTRLECVWSFRIDHWFIYRVYERRNCCGEEFFFVHITPAAIYNLWPIFFEWCFVRLWLKRIFVLKFLKLSEKMRVNHQSDRGKHFRGFFLHAFMIICQPSL